MPGLNSTALTNVEVAITSTPLTYKLDAAQTIPVVIQTNGNIFTVTNASSAGATIKAQFASSGNPQMGPLIFQDREWLKSPASFDLVKLTWDAQPGEWIEVTIINQQPAPTSLEYIRQGQLTISGIASPIQIAANQKVTVDGGSSLITGNVAISTNTPIIGSNPNRKSLSIRNLSTGTTCFIGNNGVTTLTGMAIGPGESYQTSNTAAFYGSSSGNQVTFIEESV